LGVSVWLAFLLWGGGVDGRAVGMSGARRRRWRVVWHLDDTGPQQTPGRHFDKLE
jgi:hypothetical protein